MKGLFIAFFFVFGLIGIFSWIMAGPNVVSGGFIAAALLCIGGLVFFIWRDRKITGGRSYKKQDVPAAIAKGYKVYLDGKEVNPETIDPSLYQSSVDDANRKVFLTK